MPDDLTSATPSSPGGSAHPPPAPGSSPSAEWGVSRPTGPASPSKVSIPPRPVDYGTAYGAAVQPRSDFEDWRSGSVERDSLFPELVAAGAAAREAAALAEARRARIRARRRPVAAAVAAGLVAIAVGGVLGSGVLDLGGTENGPGLDAVAAPTAPAAVEAQDAAAAQPTPQPVDLATIGPVDDAGWAAVEADPAAHAGERFSLYAEVLQMDDATGPRSFRAGVGANAPTVAGELVSQVHVSALEAELAQVAEGKVFRLVVEVMPEPHDTGRPHLAVLALEEVVPGEGR